MRLEKKLLFVVMLLSSVSAVSAQTPRQWRDSLSVINRRIASSPYSSDLHLRKAAINLELRQWEYAADEYGIVLDHEPRNPAALFYRAYANTNLRRYDLARRDYESFLGVVPRSMEAMLGLAHVCVKMQRTSEAMDHLNRLVELYPDSAVVYASRASLERDLSSYDAALYDWTQACRLAPDNTDFAISRTDVLLLLGRKDEARGELDALVGRGVPRGALREWYERCR
ncbi:MAG: tetratricopeptide repeat protein [Prevotella sp.]|nr:tetratricopeptide repeat protein [Prevotella sp.]